MAVQNLSSISLQIMAQSGLGVPAAGAGAFGIEVLPSSGLALAIQSIESNMMKRSRMRNRPRHGSRSVTAAYETELVPGALNKVFEAVLGGTEVAVAPFTNTDWGALVISGGGTVGTFATGTLLTDGIKAGRALTFAGLSVLPNNGLPVPIQSVESETVVHFQPGYLADNPSDAAWSASASKLYATTTPYLDRLFTVEEQQGAFSRSKLGLDMRFNSLNFSAQPNQMIKVGFGLGGRNMLALPELLYPNFPGATFVEGDPMILIDGGLFVNGVKRTNVTNATWGLSAPVSTIPVVGSNISPDVFIGQFALTGNFNVVMEDFDDFDTMDEEDDVSVFLHCASKDRLNFTNFYLGHMSFAGYTSPIGGEGGAIAQIPLYGGSDNRGGGYAATSVLITSSL